ncbi:tyrosine-type recombinase/integrase [Rhizobium rhizogenes]|uniref:Integrase n=1 Tax=Rhizobium rhizogenes NBRC 13257 TaxID=1220581 RepID=A0AA87U278_RHIRH|nr:tyrosine-type recombinase/integrase [Rhizobium rhizogenes]NTG67247.1 tyrosine-type recombinase/integrase [Rhizobium rhizogenes]TRB14296.1 integrase [Rhizobium rhizogenes]TRB47086.1 integrase [Rhizobium rhizogenes]TRB64853.1 integrase [Rhizobium rhizogenes]GAJ91062.1 putative integrase [Rhizobium rhizogenes NBRC 13257]
MVLKLVRRKDSPNWWLRGTIRSIYVYESTGIADRDVAEVILTIRSKEVLDESIFGRKVNATFEQAAESYLKGGGSLRFLSAICKHFGTKPLRKLRQNDLDAASLKLLPNASPETRNRQCYTPFIAVWNHAVKNDWADVRQWSRPRKRKGTVRHRGETRSGTRPAPYDRAAQFVAAMSPAPAMVMTALFYTGMRPIELFTLESADIDVDRRWIVIGNSKTGEPRGVPMHDFLVPLFESLLKRRDKSRQVFRTFRGLPYVISAEGGGQLSNGIVGTRKRLAKAGLQITDVSPYTARHSVSTQLVVNGVHPHIKDQILGHAANDMSRHYTNVAQAPLIEAINTLPVPDAWRRLDWWKDPLLLSRHHVKWGK